MSAQAYLGFMFETGRSIELSQGGDVVSPRRGQGDSRAQYPLGVPHDTRQASTKKAGISAGLVC